MLAHMYNPSPENVETEGSSLPSELQASESPFLIFREMAFQGLTVEAVSGFHMHSHMF